MSAIVMCISINEGIKLDEIKIRIINLLSLKIDQSD